MTANLAMQVQAAVAGNAESTQRSTTALSSGTENAEMTKTASEAARAVMRAGGKVSKFSWPLLPEFRVSGYIISF